MMLILLPADVNKKFCAAFSPPLTLQQDVSVFAGMGGMKETKFYSETFDSGHSLVSDTWMTFICLLLVGRV